MIDGMQRCGHVTIDGCGHTARPARQRWHDIFTVPLKSCAQKYKEKPQEEMNKHISELERDATGGSEWRAAGRVKCGWRTNGTCDGAEQLGERGRGRGDSDQLFKQK